MIEKPLVTLVYGDSFSPRLDCISLAGYLQSQRLPPPEGEQSFSIHYVELSSLTRGTMFNGVFDRLFELSEDQSDTYYGTPPEIINPEVDLIDEPTQ